MNETKITIPTDAMQAIVQKAIMESLSEDQRAVLIETALKYLLTETRTSYGRSPSPLESAFNMAVSEAAHTIAREIVKENEFDTKIRKAVRTSLEALISQDSLMAGRVGSAIGEAVGAHLKDMS